MNTIASTRPRGGSSTFTLELRAAGRDLQIAVAGGAVAMHEARELERAIVSGMGRGRTRVVIDLTGVTDVGPGLLGVLLRLRRGVTRVGGTLALVVSGPPVSDLVQTTLLGRLIPVADDRTEALALAGEPRAIRASGR